MPVDRKGFRQSLRLGIGFIGLRVERVWGLGFRV